MSSYAQSGALRTCSITRTLLRITAKPGRNLTQPATPQSFHLQHVLTRGPGGELLCTDFVAIGPGSAERVLIVNSAIHGVEGFCGSAAMTAWLSSGQYVQAANTMRVILIHALNPYGFAWLLRVNEDNVDLNRNFVNHDMASPDNADYAALHSSFLPQNWDETIAGEIREMLTQYAARHGLLPMQSRVCRGQYQHQNGLFYGGNQASGHTGCSKALCVRT